MKYAITAVAMNRLTRRRAGKARTEVIDTKDNALFAVADSALAVEERYEAFWNNLNPDSSEIIKVVDVRELT